MPASTRLFNMHTIALASVLAALTAFGAVAITTDAEPAAAVDCPPGMFAVSPQELFAESNGTAELDSGLERTPGARYCLNTKHPESFAEARGLAEEWGAKTFGPWSSVDGRAHLAAIRQRERMEAASSDIVGADSTWQPYGTGPLISNDPRFPNVENNGFVKLAGRVDSLDYDPATGRLFASVGTGGVWLSEDLGDTWRSIGDSLETQIIGAIAWTSAGGGRVLAVGGEPLHGANTYVGTGAYWTDDLGKTWHRATGVPSGIMGFQVAVDPTNPSVAYAATTKGLFRSTDAGATYVNVNLPTGPCVGNTGDQECLLANYVTDVVVQTPDTFGNTGGAVLAAVGYRVGNRAYPQNPAVIEGPSNGLYRSDTGAPDSFTKLTAPGFAPQFRIGRTELGVAEGAEQNHDYVYAIVQDAELMRGGAQGSIDAPDTFNPAGTGTVINGIYVSDDFGENWTQMANTDQIAYNPSTGSALAGLAALNPPGIQAWYNEWIEVDPTRHVNGIPTRITFGLEEVWENRLTSVPAIGPSDFHVIGRYYATETCILSVGGVVACPPNPAFPTTTHPDQHEGIYIPDGEGGVTLVVGNDGGVYKQHVVEGGEFVNQNWGEGANEGFNTLLPYFATMAKDGTVWYGLQDNGSGKIEGDTKQQFMAYGGDGFFTAVDPDNSDVAYSEVTAANMRVTTDGGTSWRDMGPFISGAKFSNPFTMDPTDANHLMTAGNEVVETTYGPDTQVTDPGGIECLENCWMQVYDLGTRDEPGNADSAATATNPINGMSALDLQGDNAYVGYCGPCGLISTTIAFRSGLATNVGGVVPPERMTPKGWHIAEANGLPERYINGVTIDPSDPRTVFVALGGYENRQWRPPGSFGDPNDQIGQGHVFVSHDAGETFTDISANLPDTPAFWVELYGNQVVVATQVGAFISDSLSKLRSGGDAFQWASLNQGLPAAPIASLQFAPHDSDLLVAAVFGRGVYTVELDKALGGGLSGCGRLAKLNDINKLFGTKGKDTLTGTAQADAICGGPGNDVIKGLEGNDVLIGGKGNDRIIGAGGNDKIYLGAGNDRSSGGKGKDRIVGFSGNDRLSGGAKRDSLNGQSGTDTCVGGSGKDAFRHCERG